MRRLLIAAVAVLTGALLFGAAVWALNVRGEAPMVPRSADPPATAAQIERGAYLARAGNCMACHTTRGGAPYAGGRPIPTPFGTIHSTNLTPAPDTGLGRWSRADFWRALHNGRSRGGRLLYPAFPYPSLTLVTREDSDALFAWLQTLTPVERANTPHELRWPYRTQAALAIWRAIYFAPAAFDPDARRSAEWNRGAYLVRGLGHCAACHAARGALGGTLDATALAGGKLPAQPWYAPSLAAPEEAGLSPSSVDAFSQLMRTGFAPGAVALGPMAEVVQHSTQYLSDHDVAAMASYLLSLARPPDVRLGSKPDLPAPATSRLALGEKIYGGHCAQCHGEQGEGVAGAYPPLAGNRAVNLAHATNLVQSVLYGGFAPVTAGNPRPFGMPPYVLTLGDGEIAAVLTHIRSAWGNRAAPVTELDVNRARSDQAR